MQVGVPFCLWVIRLGPPTHCFPRFFFGLFLVLLPYADPLPTFLAVLGCNPKVLLESPKMVDSQKWLGEGAKGLLSPGSENGVAPVQNGVAPVLNGFRMVQKTLGRLSLPGLKRPFAPSPNHFWESTIFGLSSRTFGLQVLGSFGHTNWVFRSRAFAA